MKEKSNKTNQKKKPVKTDSFIKGNSRLAYMLLGGILLLTFFVYLPSLNNKFTDWDDQDYVTENKLIAHPENVYAMLTTPVSVNYHPLTMYSLALDYKIAENMPEQDKPRVYHITNLIFHLFNIVLVFYFLMFLSSGRVYTSLACALLFAIHPMHVESVAWVSERKDVLYTFFFLLSMICYLKYLANKQLKWMLLCFGCFVLSLASKPAAVVLPVVLFAIDYFKGRKINLTVAAEKIPFLILSLILGALTFIAQAKGGAVAGVDDYPFTHRILFAFYGIMMYLIKVIFPFTLCNLYPFPNIEGQGLEPVFYIAPFVVLAIIGALAYFSKYNKVVLFGFAFFFINIFLVLQFFTVGQSIISDRYSYVSYLGLFIIATWWLDSDAHLINSYFKGLRTILLAVFAVLGCTYVIIATQRIKVWESAETLWTDAIDKFPGRLVVAYGGRGYYYRKQKQYDKAMADYNIAIGLNPKYVIPYPNRGNIYFALGKFDSAIMDYNKALQLQPDLWKTLSDRGAAKASRGDLRGAVEDLDVSIKNDPTNVGAITNRALVHASLNQQKEALHDYEMVIAIEPNNDQVLNALGVSYQQLKMYNESLTAFNKAITLAPNMKVYYTNRSISWAAIGRNDNAQADINAAQLLK